MIILFDGVCNLCNGVVNFLISHDKQNIFKFASLQSGFGQDFLTKNNKNPTDFDSIILLDSDAYFIKSQAVFKIVKQLAFPYSVLSVFSLLPKTITDSLYDLVAKNRYQLIGKKSVCRIPSPEERDKFLG